MGVGLNGDGGGHVKILCSYIYIYIKVSVRQNLQ